MASEVSFLQTSKSAKVPAQRKSGTAHVNKSVMSIVTDTRDLPQRG